jgi:hypothetical protein
MLEELTGIENLDQDFRFEIIGDLKFEISDLKFEISNLK